MYRTLRLTAAVLAFANCRDAGQEIRETGSPGAVATDSAAGSANMGLELDAARLIPGVRAQITEIEDPQGSAANLPAFKAGVSSLVNAMLADLNRSGTIDSGGFRALSDSVMRDIGGGASEPPDMSLEDARRLAPRVEQLISVYEERMRGAER